jgi:hypothetical protein
MRNSKPNPAIIIVPMFEAIMPTLKKQTWEQLAVVLCVTPGTVSKIRHSRRGISDSMRIAAMRHMKWNVEQLDNAEHV